MDDERWHALLTEPCRERLAQRHLTLLGFDAFYPIAVVRHVLRGRRFELERPLFPGYAFCRLADRHFSHASQAPGVARIVGALRPGAGEQLLLLEPAAPAEAQVARLLVGMNVRIKHGPLAGHVATLARKHRERIKLIVSMFNTDRETGWLPASWVEALSAEAEAA